MSHEFPFIVRNSRTDIYILISFLFLTRFILTSIYLRECITIAIYIQYESPCTHLYPYKVGTINSQEKDRINYIPRVEMPPTWTKGGTETEKSDKGGGEAGVSGIVRGERGVGASVGGSSGERKREEKRWK